MRLLGAYKESAKLYDQLIEREFDSLIKFHEDSCDKKRSFKESLSNLGIEGNIEPPPLKIILVDELDRCMPIYAVRFLEMVKHFFNTENTVFVMAIDKNQLLGIIKKVYGEFFDAEHYLLRFFDFNLQLPQGEAFYRKLGDVHCDARNKEVLLEICNLFAFNPREQIKFYKTVKFLETIPVWARTEYYLLVGLHMKSTMGLRKYREYNEDGVDINASFARFLKLIFDMESPSSKSLLFHGLWGLFLLKMATNSDSNTTRVLEFINNHEDQAFIFYQNSFVGESHQKDVLKDMLNKVAHFC